MDNTTIIISETTFAKMIKEKRKALFFSSEHFAELCDRSDRVLRNIESGDSTPSLDSVLNIAYDLDMALGDLNCLVKELYSDDDQQIIFSRHKQSYSHYLTNISITNI